jgi:hypothetical protein
MDAFDKAKLHVEKGKGSVGTALNALYNREYLLNIKVKAISGPAISAFHLELACGICDTVGQHADTTRNGHFIQ